MKRDDTSDFLDTAGRLCGELEGILGVEIEKGLQLPVEEIEEISNEKEAVVGKLEGTMDVITGRQGEISSDPSLSGRYAELILKLNRIADLIEKSEEILRTRRADLLGRLKRLKDGIRGSKIYKKAGGEGEGTGIIDFSDRDGRR